MEVMVGPSLRIDQVRGDIDSPFEEEEEEEDESSSDSSIGAPDDSEEEEEEEEQEEEEEEEEEEDGSGGVSSSERGKLKKSFGSLGSLASLEDSLPIKRGLSLHISGKSKSFTNLAEAHIGTVKDLEKTEHPFNKKRRMIRWSRNNYYKWSNPRSMPVLPLIEDEEEDDEDGEEGGAAGGQRPSSDMGPSSPGTQQKQRQHRVLKSRSCFALADLPEEEDDDD